MTTTDWRQEALAIVSKGSVAPKVTSLAGLHERRALSEGQYFTPTEIAAKMWSCLKPYRDSYLLYGKCNVMDPSCGNGSLLHSIDPNDANLYGVDTDPRCIEALSEDADKAGFHYKFLTASVAELKAEHFQVCLLNPPYSIPIQHPELQPFPCTTYGKYGENTSTNTHEYSLYLALDCSDVVAALLPTSMEKTCKTIDRLSHIVTLPRNTFTNENANVSTAVYFFGPDPSHSVEKTIITCPKDQWPVMPYKATSRAYKSEPVFNACGIDYSSPTITLPLTGDNTVELHHHNRRIVVKFRCGFTQAKVENALLRDLAEGDKLPKTMRYQGDSRFLLDVLILQNHPERQLNVLAKQIEGYGGRPVISSTLQGYYNKLLKRHERAITPMQRTILVNDDSSISVTAKKRMLLIPGDFTSPSIPKAHQLIARQDNGEFTLKFKGKHATISRPELHKRFTVDVGTNTSKWVQIHKGLPYHFPEIAKHYSARLDNLGITFLAPFQRHDVIEGLSSPTGYISALEQGSGKARCAIALALAHSGINAVIVETGLLPEMLHELNTVLGIDPSLYQIIDKSFNRRDHNPKTKFYLATYQTLRSGYKNRQGMARHLRRFFNTIICDEGGLLKNLHTQQTRAIRHLSARKLIISDGTPLSGFARNVLPLATASIGNGTASQPFGVKGKPYIHEHLINSASHSQRGEDVFIDKHVTLQWVTHEFSQDMVTGGRREVPRIKALSEFKRWVSPFIQRRLRAEPDLDIFNNCELPEHHIKTVKWDPDHLAIYLRCALEFTAWWKKQKEQPDKNISMVAVLAKLAAVQRAANSPHSDTDALDFQTYYPVTSKQREVIKYVNRIVEEGNNKVIVYAQSPSVLERLQSLTPHPSILYTGLQNIPARTAELEHFKHGDINIVFSSWVLQRGVNLPQCSHVVLYNRHWQATTEAQAVARTQRPSQTRKVQVTKFHLAGSIDEYQNQCVMWKKNSSDAGLDFGQQSDDEAQYQHLDSILEKFCADVMSMSAYEAKDMLTA